MVNEKVAGNKMEEKTKQIEEKKETVKKEQEKKSKPVETEKKVENKIKKTEAVVNGKDLKISTKYSVAICNYIRRKNIDKAIVMLEEVLGYKKAVPMKGEIPHRKGKIMSGRYPINAVKEFIKLLKSLKANALVQELEIEKMVISCKANVAARPYRRFGRARFKRTHVEIKLQKRVKKKEKKEGKK